MAPELAAARAAENAHDVTSYFEVHVRRDERWMIDCTAANAADALAEAEEILKRSEVLAVKVVNERYNPRTDQSAARVIYAHEKPERRKRSGPIRMIASPRTAPAPPPAAAAAAATELAAVAAAAAPTTASAAAPSPAAPSPRAAPAEPVRLRRPSGAGRPDRQGVSPWLLFTWASLALALGAAALFVFLLVIG